MEDLDVEVVSEREDRLEDSHVTDPFLRLRLRYSEGGCLPFRLFRFSFGPRAAFAETKSFDFECDETDIDLLLLRLKAAKELLLRKTARDVREPPA